MRVIGIVVIALSLSACSSPKDANESNFKKAVQAYLDTQPGACISAISNKNPFSLADTDDRKKRADSLVSAGLLSSTPKLVEVVQFGPPKSQAGAEYQVTDEGKKYFVQGQGFQSSSFCTGKYKVSSVPSFTEPGEAFGSTISKVYFLYTLEEAAAWAKSEGLKAADPNFAEKVVKDIKGRAVFVLTNNGWVHADKGS